MARRTQSTRGKRVFRGRTKSGKNKVTVLKPFSKGRQKTKVSSATTTVNYRPKRGVNKGKRMRMTVTRKVTLTRR